MVALIPILIIFMIVQAERFRRLRKHLSKISSKIAKKNQELKFLESMLIQAMKSGTDISNFFPASLNNLKETLNWTYHSIFRLDEQTQLLVIRFTGYFPKWYMDELSTKVFIKVGDASIGRAVATKQPATINLTNVDPRFQAVTSFSSRSGYKSLSCYPLTGALKTYGGFCTYSQYENIFSLHDIQFFTILSNLYAAILEQKLLSMDDKFDNSINKV